MKRILLFCFGAAALVGQVNVSAPASTKDQASANTGNSAPAAALYAGGISSGNLTGIVACDSSVQIALASATTTQMVAAIAGKSIYVCSFVLNGSNSTNSKLVYGTGTNCGTGLVSLTPAFALAFGTSVSAGGGLGYLLKVPAGNALCVNNSSSSGVNVLVSYTVF